MKCTHRSIASFLAGIALLSAALPAAAGTTFEELKSRYLSKEADVKATEQTVSEKEVAVAPEQAQWMARLSDTSYLGEVPAASGTYLVALSLSSDGAYRRVDQYGEKKGEAFEEEGTWTMTSADLLELTGSDGSKAWFIVEANGKITMSDAEGNRAPSGLNYTLGRYDELQLFDKK